MIRNDKIQPHHLARSAFIYVRQSTPDQVRHHHESRRRQYDLQEHARALGWRDVAVIDDDLGESGASARGRLGFQRLVAEVSLTRAGAVFGLEVSRLARNNRDWYQLLDLCTLMNTLIIDAEGIHDPRQRRARRVGPGHGICPGNNESVGSRKLPRQFFCGLAIPTLFDVFRARGARR